MKKVKFEIGKHYIYSYSMFTDGIEKEIGHLIVTCLDRDKYRVKLGLYEISGKFNCKNYTYAMLNIATLMQNNRNSWLLVDNSQNCGITINGQYYDDLVEYEFVNLSDGHLCSLDLVEIK